ncbi:MAG: aspartate-semialdehyde dehydrogenase [Candidatus Heimdallarchaeota archaeon]|nr:aspartate-semialdehyde dehydrogenase [Candidatus Heimdallarchaeota archaeon]
MKKKCVILGATGLIGQQFVRLLAGHPKFDLTNVYASERSTGKSLNEIWQLPNFDFPSEFSDLKIEDLSKINTNQEIDIAFSGLPTGVAYDLESDLREKGVAVFSNASAHRMDPEVPILIPEINLEQFELARVQKEKYETTGFIVTNANCSVTGAAMYMHELSNLLDVKASVVTTYQAQSGAGYKGLANQAIVNNVHPFIKNEEEKIGIEANKIMGIYQNNSIKSRTHSIIANCARVNVTDGHLESITSFVNEDIEFSAETIRDKFRKIESPLNNNLHTAPRRHIVYMNEEDRPQPKLDSYYGENEQLRGMSLMVGRMRKVENTISSYILVHNTIRGGAGGSVLNAEIALQKGYI